MDYGANCLTTFWGINFGKQSETENIDSLNNAKNTSEKSYHCSTLRQYLQDPGEEGIERRNPKLKSVEVCARDLQRLFTRGEKMEHSSWINAGSFHSSCFSRASYIKRACSKKHDRLRFGIVSQELATSKRFTFQGHTKANPYPISQMAMLT